MLKRFAIHFSNYSLGSLLVTLASLASFPILTRVFTTEEYGLMSLVATALTLLVGVGKLGVQHAAVRFYSEIRAGKRNDDLDTYAATLLWGMGAVGAIITVVWLLVSQWIPASFWNDTRVRPLWLLTACLIFIRVVDSVFVNQLRAQERSGVLNLYSVIKRYVSLGLMLAVLFWVARNLWGFYAAMIVSEGLAVAVLAVWMLRKQRALPSRFSMSLFRAMLAFGIPMIGYELSSIILAMGDRYVIQHMLGADALGVYSAAYNLCEYIDGVIVASFSAAAMPMYLRLWEEEGRDQVMAFVRRFLHVFFLVALPVVAGLAAVGAELITFLASEKYRAGAVIIPWVMAGMALGGITTVAGAGLYIEKRTRTIMLMVLAAAVLNLILNVVLIPVFDILGAAMATLLSYVFLVGVSAVLGRRVIRMEIPWADGLKFAALSLLMYVLVVQVNLSATLWTLLVRIAVGVVFYAAAVWVVDAQAREWARLAWRRVSAS